MQTKHEIRPADGFPGREHREAATRRLSEHSSSLSSRKGSPKEGREEDKAAFQG